VERLRELAFIGDPTIGFTDDGIEVQQAIDVDLTQDVSVRQQQHPVGGQHVPGEIFETRYLAPPPAG
jgi:hypothetical protein